MLKPLFLVLLIIISMSLRGCDIEPDVKEPSLQVENQYHRPIDRVGIINIPSYIYYENLNITEGNSEIFETNIKNSFEADVIVWFESEYDIKAAGFTPGKTTTVTLNENGILE